MQVEHDDIQKSRVVHYYDDLYHFRCCCPVPSQLAVSTV